MAFFEGIVIADDDSFVLKLQNSLEISNNVFLMFMNVEQKKFIGYARVNSDILPLEEFPELRGRRVLTPILLDRPLGFRIKWLTKNAMCFEEVKFIRNNLNRGSQINMCKEFHVG